MRSHNQKQMLESSHTKASYTTKKQQQKKELYVAWSMTHQD